MFTINNINYPIILWSITLYHVHYIYTRQLQWVVDCWTASMGSRLLDFVFFHKTLFVFVSVSPYFEGSTCRVMMYTQLQKLIHRNN